MNRTFLKYVLGGAVALAVGGGLFQWWRSAPAAATPSAVTVSVLGASGSWGTVGANTSGNFEVLPTVFPNAGLRFYLYAPAGTALSISLDGTTLPEVPSAGGTSASGYFRVLDVSTTFNPARWELEIQPPASKMSLGTTMMVFSIADVSLSPTNRGTDHISTPVTVTLVARKLFTLAVTLSGMGQGSVIGGTANQINCPGTCAFDFGQSETITLTPRPGTGSTFAGWTDACVAFGSGGNCVLTLNGLAVKVGASFRPTSVGSGSPPADCPAPNPPSNASYWGSPLCPASALGAVLSCKSQAYVCCADSACASPTAPVCPPGSFPLPSSTDVKGCYVAK